MSETNITWEGNTPFSKEFDDVYFSKEDGLAESSYVFLQGNNLESRWENLNSDFTIIETGFGTGLNFFSACQLWLQNDNKRNYSLHYISIEKNPLSNEDLIKAMSAWEELTPILELVTPKYEGNKSTAAPIKLNGTNIYLTLFFEDVNTALPKIKDTADAWFLDGFAPSKNPDMWSDNLYIQMARLSKSKSTFATFTCAGFVRRALIENGFYVKKIKGFSKKREMLIGHF